MLSLESGTTQIDVRRRVALSNQILNPVRDDSADEDFSQKCHHRNTESVGLCERDLKEPVGDEIIEIVFTTQQIMRSSGQNR